MCATIFLSQCRSWGNYGTTLNVLGDTAERWLRMHLIPNQASDAPQTEPLLTGLLPGHGLADRAYDAASPQGFIVEQGVNLRFQVSATTRRSSPLTGSATS